jgi:hypothetical protein
MVGELDNMMEDSGLVSVHSGSGRSHVTEDIDTCKQRLFAIQILERHNANLKAILGPLLLDRSCTGRDGK